MFRAERLDGKGKVEGYYVRTDDGTFRHWMTKEELEEFSKINGFTVKDVQYDGTYIHLNKRDYMGLCYVKAILYLANLFDLEV